jgi:hypothetical protein
MFNRRPFVGASMLAALLGAGSLGGILSGADAGPPDASDFINGKLRTRSRFKNPPVPAAKRTEPKPAGRGKKLRSLGLGGLRARQAAYEASGAKTPTELLRAYGVAA